MEKIDKITFFNAPTDSLALRNFKEALQELEITPSFYQVMEFLFRQAMSQDPLELNPKVKKENRLWFGGYKYEQFPVSKRLLKEKDFDKWFSVILNGVQTFNNNCLLGELGFTSIGLTKFTNIDKVFEDYYRIIASLEATDKTKFLDVIDKYPPAQIKLLQEFLKTMVRDSLHYNDRAPNKMVLFDQHGHMVITPKEYEYFTDYIAILHLLWEPFIGKRINRFIAEKIRFEHMGNSVATYDQNLKEVSRVELDLVFFNHNFSSRQISTRISGQNRSEKFKVREEYIHQHILPPKFLEKLIELRERRGLFSDSIVKILSNVA